MIGEQSGGGDGIPPPHRRRSDIEIEIGIERRRAWPKEEDRPHLETIPIPIAIAIWTKPYTVKRT